MAAALPAGPAPRTTAAASIGDPSNARAESGVAVDLSEVATGFYNHAKLREVTDHVLMASRIIFCTHDDATSAGNYGLKTATATILTGPGIVDASNKEITQRE